MKRIIPYLKPYRLQIGLGPLFKFIEALIELIMPLLMSAIIDRGINGNNPVLIRRYGLIMFALVFVAVTFSFSCQYMASVASQGTGTRLREALFRRINAMSQSELNRLGTSSLINRVNGDVNQIQLLVAMTIRLLSRSPVLAIGGVLMSFYVNWKMAMILLLVVPVAAVVLFFIMRSSTRYMKKALVQSDKVTELFTDNIAGSRVIRAFAREDHERSYFAGKADGLAHSWIVANAISGLMNPLTNLLFNGVIVLIIWLSGANVNTGSMTQGDVLALVNYLTQIVAALMVWANLASLFPRAFAAGERIGQILDESESIAEIESSALPVEIKDIETILAVEDLSFTYPGTRTPALDHLSFRIDRGEEMGIIGATGSGKTTIANLLTAMYPPTQGEIIFLGRRFDEWSIKDMRQEIAWIPQKAILFKGTIRSNLLFGMKTEERARYDSGTVAENADELEARMWAVLDAAQAAGFVRDLDGGLDAPVERGGQNLSGGQRQRLNIARALMRDASLYIFDDSSSALDYLTDVNMRKAVRAYIGDAAVIRISNRIHQLLHVDRILLLDNGQQAALGSHDELLEESTLYQEIAASQEGGIHAKQVSHQQ